MHKLWNELIIRSKATRADIRAIQEHAMAKDCFQWQRWSLVLLGGTLLLGIPARVEANTPLTQAEVYKLVNRVELIPRHRQPRPARIADVLAPLDSVTTQARSRADLLFNEGSLARIGGNALFRFMPGTRNFQLDRGTTIVMFPPGSEGGKVTTPDAIVEARGSIVWVKREAETTFIGALVDNDTREQLEAPVSVVVKDSGDRVELQMGERLTLQPGQPPEVAPLHLPTFHAVCKLADGLGPGEADAIAREVAAARATLLATRSDTMQALTQQNDGSDTADPATASLCQ